MHKKIALLLISLIVMVGLVACGKDNDTSSKDTKEEVKQEETKKDDTKKEEVKEENKLDKLKQAFKDAGLQVGDNETLAFDMVGATSGYKYKLDGELIETYYYDSNNLTEEGKKKVEQAKNGSIDVSGFNVPVIYKDGLMLGRVNDHSKKDKILEVFNNFK
ncbi:hypothetical protein [Clostridium intestinale]|uniref:hypothetical protein n=1 Tax=Clostridium intestinale TaxID=36845 RepID=UPI002DD6970E|nr:hypothetical protein [Clostridium intestinale]WRY53908.1 hypothetical protein P8F83_12005 [Clostridium intestinale]